MNNIKFTHEDVNYTIKYQGGRPDKYSIEFTYDNNKKYL